MGLQISRILVGFVNLGDNITGWIFSFIMQCLFLGLFPYLMYRGLVSKDKGAFVKEVKLNAKLKPKVYLLAVAIGICVYLLNVRQGNYANDLLLGGAGRCREVDDGANSLARVQS